MSHKKRINNKAERRKMMLEQRKKKTRKMMILGVFIFIIVIGAFFGLSNSGKENIQDNKQTQESPVSSETEIAIALSEISNTAKFYTYGSDDVTMRYFAVLGSEGDVHVAIDACDVCYRAKKGYRQNDDVMHCINCGLEFPINSIGTENTAGGCWPSYIPIELDGDDVIIKISDLENKGYMFL